MGTHKHCLSHTHTHTHTHTHIDKLTNKTSNPDEFKLFKIACLLFLDQWNIALLSHERITWLSTTAFMPIFRRDRGGWFMKERLRDFKGGRQKRVWITGHLSGRRNPLIKKGVWDIFSWKFPIKSLLPFPHPPSPPPLLPPLLCVFLGKLSKQSEAERERERGRGRDNKSRQHPLPACLLRDRSFLLRGAGPRSDTLTLLPDVKLYTERWTSTAFTTTE